MGNRLIIVRVSIMAAIAVVPSGCKRAAAPGALPIPEVAVTDVVQKDVPIYSEWVGTTEGFVNANIYPKISGYLLKQNYRDGDQVHAGQLLFQIDEREYKAALDQALGDLGQNTGRLQKEPTGPRRIYAALRAAGDQHGRSSTTSLRRRAPLAAAVAAAEAAVETAKLNHALDAGDFAD